MRLILLPLANALTLAVAIFLLSGMTGRRRPPRGRAMTLLVLTVISEMSAEAAAVRERPQVLREPSR